MMFVIDSNCLQDDKARDFLSLSKSNSVVLLNMQPLRLTRATITDLYINL